MSKDDGLVTGITDFAQANADHSISARHGTSIALIGPDLTDLDEIALATVRSDLMTGRVSAGCGPKTGPPGEWTSSPGPGQPRPR